MSYKTSDWLNANGLVDGYIPPKTQCPFWNECNIRNSNCPSHENDNLRERLFSCAAARAFSLINMGKEKK